MSLKTEKRFLGIDYGEKIIGFARGQSISNTATAWCILKNNQRIMSEIEKLLNQFQANAIVIGLPVDAKGKALFTTSLVEKFAVSLKKKFNLAIHFTDERYTTCDINDDIKNSNQKNTKIKKSRKDAFSAELILNQFLTENLNN